MPIIFDANIQKILELKAIYMKMCKCYDYVERGKTSPDSKGRD